MKALFHTLILTTILASKVSAEVPGIITYQGRVTSAGSNFNGAGQFKFALVSPANPAVTTFWSNDGTSVAGGEPASGVSVQVGDGLFRVLLGDPSLANMQTIPDSVFANPDVRLRIWFNDGVNGFAGLSPDQRMTSVGYAFRAAGTTDGAITTDMLADGSVSGTQLADGSVTEPKIADGAVTATKIAQPALHTTHLGDGIITTAKLANNAVTTDKIANGAVTAEKLGDGAITGAKMADNTITSAELANSITLQTLHLGGINWDGLLNLYAKPVGGGGVALPSGDLRGQLNADPLGASLLLRGPNGHPGAELKTKAGSALQLWDGSNHLASFLGLNGGASILNLWQKGGSKLGVSIDGDRATVDNLGNSGGEIYVFNSTGQEGLVLDGDHGGGGRVEVRKPNGTPQVDLFAMGESSGGEVRVKDNDGTTTVELRGQADSTQAGQIRLFNSTGKTNVVLKAQAGSDQGASLQMFNSGARRTVVLDAHDDDAAGRLELSAPNDTTTVVLAGAATATTGAEMHLYRRNGAHTIELDAEWEGEGGLIRVFNRAGESRITLEGENSAGAGRVALRDDDNTQTVEIVGAGQDSGGQIYLSRSNGDKGIELDAQAGTGGGWAGFYKPGEKSASIVLNASASGGARVTTQVLEITGGSDLSEQFNIDARQIEPRPGMILCIDPEKPGELTPSTRAYDRTAAGVISGAGGVKPGMLMGQAGTVAHGSHPVALTGRVFCWVDADPDPIQPGDFITTSDTPGYGMKASRPERAPGAIIGKAMTPLAKGKGLVLILVSLQ